jgi:hypothetical protein
MTVEMFATIERFCNDDGMSMSKFVEYAATRALHELGVSVMSRDEALARQAEKLAKHAMKRAEKNDDASKAASGIFTF